MSAKKITVKYFVDPRQSSEGVFYAVMREALYRGTPSLGFVASYRDGGTAQDVCGLLNARKSAEH